jgi:hypothetical protein
VIRKKSLTSINSSKSFFTLTEQQMAMAIAFQRKHLENSKLERFLCRPRKVRTIKFYLNTGIFQAQIPLRPLDCNCLKIKVPDCYRKMSYLRMKDCFALSDLRTFWRATRTAFPPQNLCHPPEKLNNNYFPPTGSGSAFK